MNKTLILADKNTLIFVLPATHRPFENDGRLIDGFVVRDVGSVDRALVGSPTHHCVRLRRSTGRTGTDYIHRHNAKLIGRSYREKNNHQ